MEKKMDNLEKVMNDFTNGIQLFDDLIGEISEKDLDKQRAEGKWTVRQIIHHIADSEIIWSAAIKAALGNPGCTFDFSWYILDNKWADPLFYHIREIQLEADLFRLSRKQVAVLLSLFQDPWAQLFTVSHDKLPEGKLDFSVLKAIKWQIQHLNIHLSQIKKTLSLS